MMGRNDLIFQIKRLCQSNSINPVFHKHVYISSFWKLEPFLCCSEDFVNCMWCYVAAEQLWQDRRRGQHVRIMMFQDYATSRRISDSRGGNVWIKTTNARPASGHRQLQIVAKWSYSDEKSCLICDDVLKQSVKGELIDSL